MVKHWFLATGGKAFGDLYELFFAESAKDVMDYVADIPQGTRVTELSWRGLSELTGCQIPQAASGDSLANGPLILNVNAREVIIHGCCD